MQSWESRGPHKLRQNYSLDGIYATVNSRPNTLLLCRNTSLNINFFGQLIPPSNIAFGLLCRKIKWNLGKTRSRSTPTFFKLKNLLNWIRDFWVETMKLVRTSWTVAVGGVSKQFITLYSWTLGTLSSHRHTNSAPMLLGQTFVYSQLLFSIAKLRIS